MIEVVRSVLRPNVEPEDLYHWWINELRSSDRAQGQTMVRHRRTLAMLVHC